MSNNNEANGNGNTNGGGNIYRSCLRKGEAAIVAENNLLVPPGMRLPHGWNISRGGLAIPPLPNNDGEWRYAISERRRLLSPEQLAEPKYDKDNPS